ncbi:hypothetical protein BX666DRAFT_1868669 [Dichotomocladium elegans]|nr:hypothetical protein BX666DRAFT_1868669 [Dichotomocladium elegans]
MIENLPILGDGIVGDPDDYVFTEDALDNIITRLLDQGSGTGPPPAPDSVIDALPRRALTNQEIHQRIDCAICKDEFARSELEVELPCAHLFHPDCIKPWLKMNGTCPVW